ncbi:MAG TPA: hypothetical protein VNW94_17250 [Streptosporangiaceae bacterium]|nr:hypothetical protein [Streptosporangiaceae bacterium]
MNHVAADKTASPTPRTLTPACAAPDGSVLVAVTSASRTPELLTADQR